MKIVNSSKGRQTLPISLLYGGVSLPSQMLPDFYQCCFSLSTVLALEQYLTAIFNQQKLHIRQVGMAIDNPKTSNIVKDQTKWLSVILPLITNQKLKVSPRDHRTTP